MNRVIFNAYQNACDCIYYGYGKSYWNDCGLDNESIANQVWKAAKNDLASNDTNRPYDEPSVETKKTLEKLSKEYEKVSDSRKISDRKHYEGDNNNYTEYKNCDYVIEGGARFSTEGEDFQQKTSEATIWVNSNIGKTDFWRNIVIPTLKKKFKNFGYIGYYTWDESSDNVIGVKLVSDNGITDDDVMNVIDEFMLICNQVSDSRKVSDSNEDELNDFLQIIHTAVKDHNLKVRGKQNWHDNTLEIEFGEDFLFKNPAKIKIKQGSFQEMKTDLFSQISKWLSKHTKREVFANRIRDMYNGLVYRLNNYVSDSRKVKDGLDEDMKLWEERSKDEFGKVLNEIEKYCIDLWGLTNDYEVEGLEQSIISKYINTYALDGDRNYVARRIYRTLENFDMIDNMDDPHFMELVNEMLKLGGVNNISDSLKINDTDDEYLLQEIARQLEEGYYAGYEPQWDIDITVDGMDISEFDDYDKGLIYRDIAYVVKDGYDEYMGIQTELSDGSIVYVDFVLNY